MYYVTFSRKVLSEHDTLEEAAAARIISGDLIFKNGKIEPSHSWLWEWEKKDPNCYAQRAIRRELLR